MKLNSTRRSGWRGTWGWKNILDPFLREREFKKITKAVETVTKHSTIPVERSLVIYQPKFEVKPIRVSIPLLYISLKNFIGVIAVLAIILTTWLSFGIYDLLRQEIDYRSTVKHQIEYNIEKALEVYREEQKLLKRTVDEHSEIMIQSVPMRKEILKRLHDEKGVEFEKTYWVKYKKE